jgi:opacity protein-like surface antigen
MLKTLFLCAFAFLVVSNVQGQDVPKAELFGGYSYAGSGSHGFDVSIAGNVNDWFGLVGDIGGQYSRLTDQGFTERINSHSFLFGPRFSVRKNARVTPFAHSLFGFSKLLTETNEFGPLVSFSDSSFTMALGGGLDVRLTKNLAVRAVQLEYLHTRFFNESQHKGRLSFGLVVRSGRR